MGCPAIRVILSVIFQRVGWAITRLTFPTTGIGTAHVTWQNDPGANCEGFAPHAPLPDILTLSRKSTPVRVGVAMAWHLDISNRSYIKFPRSFAALCNVLSFYAVIFMRRRFNGLSRLLLLATPSIWNHIVSSAVSRSHRDKALGPPHFDLAADGISTAGR